MILHTLFLKSHLAFLLGEEISVCLKHRKKISQTVFKSKTFQHDIKILWEKNWVYFSFNPEEHYLSFIVLKGSGLDKITLLYIGILNPFLWWIILASQIPSSLKLETSLLLSKHTRWNYILLASNGNKHITLSPQTWKAPGSFPEFAGMPNVN